MSSIAIWYEPNETKGDPELDLHFNHWKLKKAGNESDYFLDVGLKITKGESIANICLFLPQEIHEPAQVIEDLGCKFLEKRVVTAIFNENYETRTTSENKWFIVTDNSGKSKFGVYSLDIKHDIDFQNMYGGTILKFNFKCADIPTYYRFRLKTAFVKGLSYIYKPKNTFLESAFSSVEIFDFRVNDTRNLQVSLVERMQQNKEFKIKLIHLFLMRNAKDEFITSNESLKSIRILEEETWNTYINIPDYKYEKSIAYHLKKKSINQDGTVLDVENFIAMLKFRFEDNALSHYFLYLIGFVLLTEIVGSAIYTYLEDQVKSDKLDVSSHCILCILTILILVMVLSKRRRT